jgi:hypothetical protein
MKGSTSDYTGSLSMTLDPGELKLFEKHIVRANQQLGASKADVRLLILIEEGHRPIRPQEVALAFSQIQRECFSNVSNVYMICGRKISEIVLP